RYRQGPPVCGLPLVLPIPTPTWTGFYRPLPVSKLHRIHIKALQVEPMKMMLLGGWGMPAGVLEPLRLAMGVLHEACWTLDSPLSGLRQRMLAVTEARSVSVGWPWGGVLAVDLAAEALDRLIAVVTIGTTPRCLLRPGLVHGSDRITLQTFAH